MKLMWILVLGAALKKADGAMTEAQMKAALKLIRNVCQPKNKATDAQIAAMHNGDWNQDKNGMCYMNCVLNYYKLQLPDNSFDWETGLKVVESQAPPSMAGFIMETITGCKDAVKTRDDKCKAAVEITKCLYDQNPEKYFLP
ncbi:general odorant-binding protein 72 isoform X2 [Dendroctonus ponderosae]|uniref:Odorant-binding protein n=2 Tax=Dendroctonus ponderosae TaxID=77166 RepID=I1VJ74_DENPD|nr:general odorant-binding protein 72 isoform X2 [Dendroctonus ponderosae]AFI45058.1 odorant-binding protein [Dendroctonus ponderosae]